MRTEIEYDLRILHKGVVEIKKVIAYFAQNGRKITEECYRETLIPGQFEEAEKLLDERRLVIVRSAWTEEVIEEYQESQKEELATELSDF